MTILELERRIAWIGVLVACAIAIAPRASAQDERAPWWSRLPVPGSKAQARLLETVQATPASAFDPGLPPIPLDTWLFVTLAPRVEVVRPRFVEWRVDFCGGYAPGANPSIVTATGPELCAKGTVQFSAERSVQLVVNVADAVRDEVIWRPMVPSLREIYIERLNELTRIDSLDVPKLSELADMLQAPFDQWPQLDFDSEITWDPPKPVQGEDVRFSLLVRNIGKRSVDRAWITILIAPCCDPHLELRREWFPKIAAGASVRVDWQLPLPEGRALASASVRAGPSAKRIRETHREERASAVFVGAPLRLQTTPSQMVGHWTADLSKSKLNTRVRSSALDFAVDGDVVSITDRVTNLSGQEVGRGTIRFQVDGREHPHDELIPGLVAVARWRGAFVLETILTRRDGQIDRVSYEVSSDGKTLTTTSGNLGEQKTVFDRK